MPRQPAWTGAEEPTPDQPWPLIHVRHHRGLSRAALAAQLPLSPQEIAAWEGAAVRSRPRTALVPADHIPDAMRLARALGVHPLAIVECSRLLCPDAGQLPRPRHGQPDRRLALVPFVHWLRGVLAQHLWTPADLGARLGIGGNLVMRWADGAGVPNRRQRAALAALVPTPGVREQLDAWAGDLHPDGGWTEDEEAVVLAHAGVPAAVLGAVLGRSATAVAKRRAALLRHQRADGAHEPEASGA